MRSKSRGDGVGRARQNVGMRGGDGGCVKRGGVKRWRMRSVEKLWKEDEEGVDDADVGEYAL